MQFVGTEAKRFLEQLGAGLASRGEPIQATDRSVTVSRSDIKQVLALFVNPEAQEPLLWKNLQDLGVVKMTSDQTGWEVNLMRLKGLAQYNGIGSLPGQNEIEGR